MSIRISNLKKRWEALELELFVPARLSRRQMEAIEHVRRTPHTHSALTQLSRALPVALATMPAEQTTRLLGLADQDDKVGRVQCYEKHMMKDRSLLNDDLKKLHHALFQITPRHTGLEFEVGEYRHQRAARLHADTETTQPISRNVGYVMRFGALPLEAITGERLHKATADEMRIIHKAREYLPNNSANFDALTELREQKILKPLPLATLYMFLSGTQYGTLHCSSPVRPEGVRSGFIRYTSKYTA